MSGAEGLEDEPPECVEAHIDLRINKLQNRRFFLQQMQQVTRRAEDDEDVSELELVEKELQELLRQKETLSSCRTTTDTGPVGVSHYASKVETEGGIYTLPPLHFTPDPLPPPMSRNVPEPVPPEEPPPPPEEPPVEPSAPTDEEADDIKHIEPADCLGRGGAFTLCPSCEQVVFTQTKKFNGESVWIMSCIVGFICLCFVPFCMDRLKSVRHKCPQCQTTIHTYHPF